MSVKKERTIAVLMRFVITPKDPTPALVNQDIFFIRTSNFDAEAERSYIFWRFEAETFLKMFLNLRVRGYGGQIRGQRLQ